MNIDLLKRLKTQLEKVPLDRFDQKGMWVSFGDEVDGLRPVIPDTLGWTLLLQNYMAIGENRFLSPVGVEIDPRLTAQEELGLTHREAADLFTFSSEVVGLHNPRNIAKWIGEIIETGRVRIPRHFKEEV